VWSAGELGLDGRLQPIRGALAIALAARRGGARALLVPEAVAAEAALVEGLPIWSSGRLELLLARLRGQEPWPSAAGPSASPARSAEPKTEELAAVRGQLLGRRALEVAAAGGHHLLLVGPPGGGKTMLARCLPGLLPGLSAGEALELTQLHSVAGLLAGSGSLVRQRPFRAPHHGCSAAALVGGGALPRPGELSLAHQGVLFLDELTEFRREVLEQLRQPLEEGEIWLSRNRLRCRFPCRTTLVAATNPCPCGWYGDPQRACRCGHRQRLRYWSRLSGPLLDRIDLQVMVRRLEPGALEAAYRPADPPESTAVVAARVAAARQHMRQRNPDGCSNSQLGAKELRQLGCWSEAGLALWRQAGERRRWSARCSERLLRVALTLADLSGTDQVGPLQIAEALHFRCLEDNERLGDGLEP
jgi:magnesium chelatase family protein